MTRAQLMREETDKAKRQQGEQKEKERRWHEQKQLNDRANAAPRCYAIAKEQIKEAAENGRSHELVYVATSPDIAEGFRVAKEVAALLQAEGFSVRVSPGPFGSGRHIEISW